MEIRAPRLEDGLHEKMMAAADGVLDSLYEDGACDENQVFLVMLKTNVYGDKEIHGALPRAANADLLQGVMLFVEELADMILGAPGDRHAYE